MKVFENYVIKSTVHSQQKSVFKKKKLSFYKEYVWTVTKDIDQLVECLCSIDTKPCASSPDPHKPGMVAHICKPRIWDIEVAGSEVQVCYHYIAN